MFLCADSVRVTFDSLYQKYFRRAFTLEPCTGCPLQLGNSAPPLLSKVCSVPIFSNRPTLITLYKNSYLTPHSTPTSYPIILQFSKLLPIMPANKTSNQPHLQIIHLLTMLSYVLPLLIRMIVLQTQEYLLVLNMDLT